MRSIVYENLRIKGYDFISILDLSIENEINEHGKLKLKAMISKSLETNYIEETEKEIEVYIKKDNSEEVDKVLFHGYVTKMDIKVMRGIKIIELEGKTMSYLLDKNKKSRSFQNIKLRYNDLISKILEEYKNINYIINIPNEEVDEFIIQYEETDWQFLKRISSKFNEGIIPGSTSDKIQIYIGTPNVLTKVNEEIHNYRVIKNLSEYHYMKNNFLKDAKEVDYTTIEIKSNEILKIGEHIPYKNLEFYVYKSYYAIRGGIMENVYLLRNKNGLRTEKVYNKKVCGSSINGKIINTKGELVQIHLDIDKVQDKGEAYWFKFSTMAASSDGSGWYCMPEVGDSVRVYFPTKDEDAAFAVSAVSEYLFNGEDGKEDLMGNPDDKYLKTANDKSVRLTPEGIFLSCNGGVADVKLKSDGTVSISSANNVNITSENDIKIEASKKIKIAAKETVYIGSDKNSAIELDGEGNIKELGVTVNNN